MSENYRTAMRIFVDFYGQPNWETKTKEGQSPEEIRKIWIDELNGYAEYQVKEACYRMCKYRKVMTFPTISHVMAQLVDEKGEVKQYSTPSEKSQLSIWYENFMKRTDYLKRSLQLAIDDMIDDCKKSLPFEAKQGLFTFTDELKLADANGFTARIDDYLRKYNKIEDSNSMTFRELEERKNKLFD
jgi:hypothetical protein